MNVIDRNRDARSAERGFLSFRMVPRQVTVHADLNVLRIVSSKQVSEYAGSAKGWRLIGSMDRLRLNDLCKRFARCSEGQCNGCTFDNE